MRIETSLCDKTLVLGNSRITLGDIKRVVISLLPILLLIALSVIFSILTGGRFLSTANLNMIVTHSLLIGCIATGAIFVFSSGNLNMAMGVSTAIACIFGGWVFLATGSAPLMLLSSIGGGLLILGLCCLLSQVFRISVIVVTMIMMQMLQALQNWLVGTNHIRLDFEAISAIRQTDILLILFIVFFSICFVLFKFTKLGRILKFIGENKVCARQTGLNENKMVVLGFAITGVAVGIAAFIYLVRNAQVTNFALSGMNMDVMLAVVLGGTPIIGGSKSKIYSGIVGALLVAVIGSGLLMLRVDALWIQAVRGLFFIVVIAMGQKRQSLMPVRNMVGS